MLLGRITRVKELLKAGITLAYGQDYICNEVYPSWGTEDPLEIGIIMAHAAQFSKHSEIEILLDMPTYNSAKILKLSNYGIHEGATANFNILGAKNLNDIFSKPAERLHVISNGKVIAETSYTKKLHLD
jgi:cytosine deaminase